MNSRPTVSICCLTYNHKDYIREALDSFLGQQCDFAFEIVVHDDLSDDGTREILLDYAARYPDTIKLLLPETKQYYLGLVHIHKKCFDAACGEFIALCEGDDYWVDMSKLQKQVDYMRSHPGCGLVHTANKVYKQEQGKFSNYQAPDKPLYHGHIFHRLLLRNRINTPTTLFRADYACEIMDSCLERSIAKRWSTADLPLWFSIAHRSQIGYLRDVTAVYRFSDNSISHNKDRERRFAFFESTLDIHEWALSEFKCDPVTSHSVLSAYYIRGYKMCVKQRLQKITKYRRKVEANEAYVQKHHILKFASRHRFVERLLTRRMFYLQAGALSLGELAEEIGDNIALFI